MTPETVRVAVIDRGTAREIWRSGRRLIPARAHCDRIALSVLLDDGSPAIVGIATLDRVIDLARSDVPLDQARWVSLDEQRWWLLTDAVVFEQAIEGLSDGSVVDGGLRTRLLYPRERAK